MTALLADDLVDDLLDRPRFVGYVHPLDMAHAIERRRPTDGPWDDVLAIGLGIAFLCFVYWLGEQMPAPTMPVDPRLWVGGR